MLLRAKTFSDSGTKLAASSSAVAQKSKVAGAVRHVNNLDARLIKTEAFLRTQVVVDDCIEFESLGVIVGNAGHGKTFATDAALAASETPVIKTLFSYQATPREVARQLIGASTGVSPSGTRFEMIDHCVELFRSPMVAVIDEAQHLNRDCTFFLRHLLDHPETHVAIILVGGNGCWENIAQDPMLKSRVYRRIRFRGIPEDELVKSLPSYHPLYANAGEELLRELYFRSNISQLRSLAIFTHTAVTLTEEENPVLTEKLIEKALLLIADDDL